MMLRCLVLLLFWGFSSSYPTITLLEGSQFMLQCLLESDLLSPEFSWSFSHQLKGDLGRKLQFSPLGHTDQELELKPVKFDHAGTYKCVTSGLSEMGTTKIKLTFKILVIETPPLIKWTILEGDEGGSVTLPCFSSYPVNITFDNVKWFKVKDLESAFESQELKPAVRKSTIKEEKPEALAGRVYWASDQQETDWSITIDKVELDDESLYRCDISTPLKMETNLLELVIKLPRCSNQSHPWEACPDPTSMLEEAILRESFNEFAVNLYKKLNEREPERNLLFSPISITVLLSNLLLGTRGETRDHLEQSLFLPPGFSCIHSEVKRLLNKTNGSILIANQMFVSPELKVHETFINQSLQFYNSVPQALTNDINENVRLINNWVATQTHNKIPKLVDFLDESTEFILLNAVYFIGKWKETFKVQESDFTKLSGATVSVPSLYSSNFNLASSYIKELKAQVGKFPLTGKNHLYILLPNLESKKGLEDLEKSLSGSNIRSMVKDLDSVEPILSDVLLPKLKFLVNTDLLTLLKSHELSGLFSDPNLCGLFDQRTVTPLSDARHRAFLSLSEKGVEAAAVSSITFARSFSNFNAMRPFILILWNEEIESPLFFGRVLHPEKTE